MIVTIDGPAGAGKSSVSRLLADRIGFSFLDTGAMYRAVTWAALEAGIDLQDPEALKSVAARTQIAFDGERVLVNSNDVTTDIRTTRVTSSVSEIADNPAVRERLVELQREIAERGNFVCEGRDQGTVVFPNAECKIFLTASPEARAQRRFFQLTDTGTKAKLSDVLAQQNERDRRDESRPVGNLKKAEDAVEVWTDDKSLEQVTDELVKLVRSRQEQQAQ